MSEKLLNEKQAADALSVSVQTLRRWRGPQQTGPAIIRFGRSVKYSAEALEAWRLRCTVIPSATEAEQDA